MRVAWVLGIALVGCYSPSPAPGSPCSSLGECPVGLECRDDVCELPGGGGDGGIDVMADDALIDAAIDACPAARCVIDEIIGCGTPVTCAHGCADNPPHCVVLTPSNGITTELLAGATAALGGTDDLELDTGTGRIRAGGNTIVRDAGTGLVSGIRFEIIDGAGVFAATSFMVGAGDRWNVNGPNPLVLYAATSITVAGNLDASATNTNAGPGGSGSNLATTASQCRGRAGRFLAAQRGEGGGGGGASTTGGNGGASAQANPTGLGGEVCTSRSTTIPLRGGAGGGAGGANLLNSGGGGGGAIMLVAMDAITIANGGVVTVSGGGGISGNGALTGSGDGGGGGGAGGAVLLEAPAVTVNGAVTANGGSGASPFTIDGNDGRLDSISAIAGGTYSGPGGSATGGAGGARNSGPGNGGSYFYDDGMSTTTSVTHRGAGGGGATGRIEIRATDATLTNAVISPAYTSSAPDYE